LYLNNIKTPELRELIINAKQSAEEKNLKKACEFLDVALSKNNAPEFNNHKKNDEPLELKIKTAKACYEFQEAQANQLKVPQIEKSLLALLKEYRKAANGKAWGAYTGIRFRLIIYYIANKQFDKAEKEMEKFIDYDINYIVPYLTWGLQINLPASKVEKKIDEYVKKTGIYNSEIILYRIQYKAKDGGNVFEDTIDFIREYPTTSPTNLKTALALLRKSIDVNDVKQVKKYYNSINRLAFEQPSTEDGLTLVSEIIDEKKKVEMIVPSVTTK